MPARTRTRTVLFLISDTGGGHRSAANAIRHAMQVLDDERATRGQGRQSDGPRTTWRAVVVDAFAEAGRFPLKNGVFLYGPATKYSPKLYGHFFHFTNTSRRFQRALQIGRPFLTQGLRHILEETRPDVIVSVHPLLNHITLRVLRSLGLHIPVLTVVTDLFNVHVAWIAPGVSACVVPTDTAREIALEGGVPRRRVHQLGMPIDPAYAAVGKTPRDELRRALGLDPDLPTVLLVGGGEGTVGVADSARRLCRSDLPAQVIVVCGRNKALLDELERMRPEFTLPVALHGFVQNMPELMAASDVILTKAGPGTICEAMACGLPILLTGAIPGQEEGNVDYVVDNRLGILAPDPDTQLDVLRRWLEPGNAEAEAYRQRVRRLAKPLAALDIARLIFSYQSAASTLSPWESLRTVPRGTARYLLRPPSFRPPRLATRRLAHTLTRTRLGVRIGRGGLRSGLRSGTR